MDAKIRLAISARLNQIFQTSPGAETFLSFPKEAPYVFTPSQLSMMLKETAEEMGGTISTMSELSRMVNHPVRGILYDNFNTEEVLWNVYGEVLKIAEVALAGNQTDEADLKKANEALYITDPDGFPIPNERYARYLELRDQYFIVQESIASIDAAGDDPAGMIAAQKERDDLKKEMAQYEYEKAMELVIDRVTENNPSYVWQGLKSKYNPDTKLDTSLELIEYAPTYIFPADIMRQDWDTITLSKDEVLSLIKSAPEEIKKAFPPLSGDVQEGVKFEYRSVKLERSWFEPKLFNSRFWRYPADLQMAALAYDGHNGSAGRFPAYIAALVLVRNLRTDSGTLIEDGRVMSMAYVCKWLPACPNPDPSAHWMNTIKTARLTLSTDSGGLMTVKCGNEIIGSGDRQVGDVITLMAQPDSQHVLSHWKVNGKTLPAGNGTLVLSMPEEGLDVIPIWAVAQSSGNMKVRCSGSTLVSISDGPNLLDMNMYKDLLNIETIGENAFSNYTNLRQLIIGSNVVTIARNAFFGCKDLENITIPAATHSIDPNAFRRDNHMESPIIKVDENNSVYTALNGQLVDKQRTTTMNTVRCKCGSTFYYCGSMPSECPNCGASLSESNVKEAIIQRPDEVVPFKLVADEAFENIKKFLKKKSFADPKFRQEVDAADLGLRRLYIPYWEWTIQSHGTYEVEIANTVNTTDKDGKTKSEVKKEVKKTEVSCPENTYFVAASKIMPEKNNTFVKSGTVKQSFSPSKDEIYELYTCNSSESQLSAHAMVSRDLQQKAINNISDSGVKKVLKEDLVFVSEKSTLTALPFWTGSISFKNKRYAFLVNGNSGTVTARNGFPKNKKKILITVGICAVIVAFIVLLILSKINQ